MTRHDPSIVPVLVFTGPGDDDDIVVHAGAPGRIIALASLRAGARWGHKARMTHDTRRVGDGTTYFAGDLT